MDQRFIEENYYKITRLLNDKRLSEAIENIYVLMENLPIDDLKLDLQNIEMNYKLMLNYMSKGIDDPEREKVHSTLLTEVCTIADKVRLNLLVPNSFAYYFEEKRRYNYDYSTSFEDIIKTLIESKNKFEIKKENSTEENPYDLNVSLQHEEALNILFHQTWLNDFWNRNDAENFSILLNNPDIMNIDKAVIVSAVTLSLMEHFDEKKLLFLFDAYDHEELIINQRAIVGIVFTIYYYCHRIPIYKEVYSRLKMLEDDPLFSKNMIIIQHQLLQSMETEKIEKKMSEEIIPAMLKNSTLKKKSDDPKNSPLNIIQDDMNPEWSNWMEKSGIEDKLREMSDLQAEGADVYMATFAQLKTYPFFREITNWFYPFTPKHSWIIKSYQNDTLKGNNNLSRSLIHSHLFCDSDKYSFCFTMSQMADTQKKMIAQQLSEQNEIMNEQIHEDQANKKTIISRSYINDLYRFHKIFYRRIDFLDPFKQNIRLYLCDLVDNIFDEKDTQLAIADYLFRHEFYSEARILFLTLMQKKDPDTLKEVLQKLGYCMQKTQSYSNAIKYYSEAEIIDPDNVWTSHHLAICYKAVYDYDMALKYYMKIADAKSSSIPINVQIAFCLMQTYQYEKALNFYYKIEFLEENAPTTKVWKYIAWCSLLCNKLEKAKDYSTKLLHKEYSSENYLLAGNICWVMGQRVQAFNYYHQSLLLYERFETFNDQFNKDSKDLLRVNLFKKDDVPLIHDILFTLYKN